jgi:hypothetical protein
MQFITQPLAAPKIRLFACYMVGEEATNPAPRYDAKQS